jgi:hypothetical protein
MGEWMPRSMLTGRSMLTCRKLTICMQYADLQKADKLYAVC